ncbi:unnamed protein product [Mycena citricolor]|uniref:NmrA-like domain-containing protein n=1 Tax=Mycena citricolor TaxID=2018698 RepID=A0AAD2Q516_9AGAR|nr:unnamed protein product [Mycena citricolor]
MVPPLRVTSTMYTSFALAGLGSLGQPMLNALLAQKVSTIVLSRTESSTKRSSIGAQCTVQVDYSAPAALTETLKRHRIDAVISTLAVKDGGMDAQRVLAAAAKAAGVKIFVPSEFGVTKNGRAGGVFQMKNDFIDYLREIDLPCATFYVGMFIEFLPWLLNLDEGTAYLLSDSDAEFGVTSTKDIADFVTYVLTHLPPFLLENQTFTIHGDRTSLKRLPQLLRADTIEFVHEIPGPAGDRKGALQKLISAGAASEEGSNDNHLWPEHQWLSIRDVLMSNSTHF